MAEKTNTANQTPQGSDGTGEAVQQSPSDQTVQTPKIDSQDKSATPQNLISQDEIEEKIKKARADEKSKVFSKVETLKKQEAERQAKIAELEKDLADARNSLDDLRKGKASELESIAQELVKQREMNEKLNAAIEQVASESAARIRESEIKAYREKALRENKVRFTDQIIGNSEEEIDAAIERTKKREEEILAQLREDVRAELSDGLPKPISPDGQLGRGPTSTITPQNREAIAHLSGTEYQKERKRLLEEAKQKVGLLS